MSTTPAQVVAFPDSAISTEDAFLRGLRRDPTRRAYQRVLNAFQDFMGGHDKLTATRRQVEAYRAALETQGRSPATVALHLACLSSFYDYALADEVVVRNPVAAARRPKVSDYSPRTPLAVPEVQALFAACDQTLVGLRDRAMLALLAIQGWRIGEVLGLRLDDLGEESGHKVAVVRGKGGRVDRVTLSAWTWEAVTTWCETAGIEDGAVFVVVGRSGALVQGKPMSQQSAWKRLRMLGRRAGIRRNVHAHLLRHTAVTELLVADVPLHRVQDFARHASPSTTRRYDGHRRSLSNPSAHVLAARLVGDTAP